jgi:hypothetical protein
MSDQIPDSNPGQAERPAQGDESSGIHFHNQATIHGNLAARDYYDFSSSTGVPPEQLALLLQPIRQAVQAAPPEKHAEAEATVQQIEQELVKGKEADDGVLAKLLNSLVDMVPGAISAVVSSFASPILAGLTGPVTKIVLDSIRRK